MLLAHEVISAPSAKPQRSLMILHGLLGQGQNWRSMARKIVDAKPDWAVVLPDLRRHGKSLTMPGPDTLPQAASDAIELAKSTPLGLPVEAIAGHSLGGKLVLEWLLQAPVARAFWIDSTASTRPATTATQQVVQVLETHPGPFATKRDFISAISANPVVSPMVAQWLATSLVPDGDLFRFGPPLHAIRELMRSFAERDLWDVLEQSEATIHTIWGDRSDLRDPADDARVEALVARMPATRTLDRLPAGHWVHIDDPAGVLRSLTAHL